MEIKVPNFHLNRNFDQKLTENNEDETPKAIYDHIDYGMHAATYEALGEQRQRKINTIFQQNNEL